MYQRFTKYRFDIAGLGENGENGCSARLWKDECSIVYFMHGSNFFSEYKSEKTVKFEMKCPDAIEKWISNYIFQADTFVLTVLTSQMEYVLIGENRQ